MILVTHALVGAAIGKTLQNPFGIIALCLISHYAFDHLRHGEYLDKGRTVRKNAWKVALDLIAGLLIIFLYLNLNQIDRSQSFRIILGAFFSMFPDLLTVIYWTTGLKFLKKIYSFHAKVHKFPEFSPERSWNLRNGINDFALSLISIAIIFLL